MNIPDELVSAFCEATPLALREMAEVEAIVRETSTADSTDRYGDVSAILRLTTSLGDVSLVMSYPEQTAKALAEHVLASVTDNVSREMVNDCVGEVANVVAGQAKAMLVGSPAHFTLSTPVVREGDTSPPSGDRRVIEFDSNVGVFVIQLCQ